MDMLYGIVDAVAGRHAFAPRPADKPYSVRVADAPGTPWRNADTEELRTVPFAGCDTVPAMLEYAVANNGPRNALGTRELIKVEHVPDPKDAKRTVEKLTLGDYKWLTYDAMAARIAHLATGLTRWAGLAPGQRVVVYAETKAEWQLAAQAVLRRAGVVVTVYATLGEDGVRHGVAQTRASLVVCDGKLLRTFAAVAAQCPRVTHVATIGDAAAGAKALPPSIAVRSLADLAADGATGDEAPAVPSKPADLAVIMYTSGTTGAPKGVLISHSNIAAAVAGLLAGGRYSATVAWPTERDTYLAYLPLAHIMEFVAEVGYGTPQTLNDTGLKLAPGTRGDAPVLRPTFIVFPPTVLDRVRQGVAAKVAAAGGVAQFLFDRALQAGLRDFDAGRIGAPPAWDLVVFKGVQAALGGRVEVMLVGSAPLSAETQRYIQSVFNCIVRQGYGLTETCCAATLGAFEDNSWSAGRVLQSVRVKLRDWDEGGYRAADEANPDIGMPRGEVCIGGPCVAMGYLESEDAPDAEVAAKNREDFSVDAAGVRWFHTGDIGQFTRSGMLQIIDRKKDLVKLQMGEYVALSKVENAMRLSPYVEQCAACARPTESATVALVVVAEKALRGWAAEKARAGGLAGVADADTAPLAALCAHAEAAAEVLASVRAGCASAKLAAFETPAAVALLAEPWTPETDLVTAAMKLKRPVVAKAFAAQIDAMYAKQRK